MRSQTRISVQFCLLISFLIFGACAHKPDTFKIDLEYEKENIQLEQKFFSNEVFGRAPETLMGIPKWKDCLQSYQFTFELDNISSLNYAYMSIETYEVEAIDHPIYLNKKRIGWLKRSIDRNERDDTYGTDRPMYAATQIYLPKHFFRKGANKLVIRHAWPERKDDKFAIGRVNIVVVNIKDGLNAGEIKPPKKGKRHFPKDLRFFSKLTDEELYISMIQLPSLFTELNFDYGVYRKKLSYIYSKIGDYYRWNGDYTQNLLYQEKAVETELKEGFTSLIPYLRANLGLAQYYMGDYHLSIATYKQALSELEKVNKKLLKKISQDRREDLGSLKGLINAYIALAYHDLEKFGLAEQYCDKVVSGLPLAIVIRAQVLGNIHTRKKNFQVATNYYRHAIDYLMQNAQIYRDPILNNKLYLANTYYLQGKAKEVDSLISSVENPTHEFKWRSHLLKGKVYLTESRLEEAVDQFSQSIEEIEFSRAKLNSHGFKVNFMNDKQVPYQNIIGSLEKLGDSKKAFYYAEKAKARAFVDLIASSKDVAYRKDARLKELSNEEKRLRENLTNLQNRLDNEQKMFKERGVNQETEIKLENARSALEGFYKTKAAQNEYFASLSAVGTLTMQDVMKVIPAEISLVEYYYDPNHLYIWVVDNKQNYFVKKDIQSSDLENLTKAFRNLVFEGKNIRSIKIVTQNEQRVSSSKRRFKKLNDALASILLDGVFDNINTNKVYIVPHGILHYLPFQMLTYRSNHLIEKYQIGYIPSATALKFVFAKRKEKSGNLLALGNPELNTPQMQLPFAEQEVRGLKDIYPGAKVLVGEDATEANFKKQAGIHDIVHVASHGEFNSNTPLLSCLRLSAGNGEDGRLETREIFGLNLDAYLVTLSACNTAIGKLTKGDEVVGLTRAFIFAGTPSILGTIWSVNDESTSIFMNHFYNNLKTMDKLKSLQQAQIAMIHSEKYSNPYHWAGFQLIGDYY